MLSICLNVDYRVLFTPLTEEVVRDGFEFYTTFYNSPPAIKVRTLSYLWPPFASRRTNTRAVLPSLSRSHCAPDGMHWICVLLSPG